MICCDCKCERPTVEVWQDDAGKTRTAIALSIEAARALLILMTRELEKCGATATPEPPQPA